MKFLLTIDLFLQLLVKVEEAPPAPELAMATMDCGAEAEAEAEAE
jgi:hypothetical protein